MFMWFPANVDDDTCLIYLQRRLHEGGPFQYVHMLQDSLNARFPSHDKRQVEVQLHGKTVRLLKKVDIHYEVHQQRTLGETWCTALPHANI